MRIRQVRQGIFGHQRHVGRGTVPHKFSLIIRKTERLTKEIEPPTYTLNIYIYIYIYICMCYSLYQNYINWSPCNSVACTTSC